MYYIHKIFTGCIHHADKVVRFLCILSVCTVCWIYTNVSDMSGRISNRHVIIANSHRWNELLNGSHEQVWPKTFNETDDRIQVQLRFMEYYGSLPVNRTIKRIHCVGALNFDGLREGQYHFVEGRCPIQECSIMSNQMQHLADVLLISEMSFFNFLQYLPKPRHQLWIAQHWESAMHDRINTWLMQRYINWTVSYRRDSTIAISYGKYARTSDADSSQRTIDYSAGKTKHVAWIVSNCHAANNRLEYAHELAKYIDVDIYGACGSLVCNATGSESCHNLLAKNYRFFLAFENSNCKDYITEKLYHAALQYVHCLLILCFCVLTLLYRHHEEYPACKIFGDELLEWLFAWTNVQMILHMVQRISNQVTSFIHSSEAAVGRWQSFDMPTASAVA